MNLVCRAFLGCGAALVLAVSPAAAVHAAPAPPAPVAPFRVCPNLGFQVQSPDGATSSLGYFDLNSSTFVPIKNVGSSVNAIGYSRKQRVFWGMRTNPGNDTLVRIDSKGNTTDIGPIEGPGLTSVRTSTGTVDSSDRLILHTKDPANELVAVDVDPTDGTVGAVLDRQPLSRTSPGLPYLEIGDWDFNPDDGHLYSLEMRRDGKRVLVSIDPASGIVTDVVDLTSKLPDGHHYGAVYVEEGSGTVYVSNNDVDDLRNDGKPGARSQTFGIYPSFNPPVVIAYTPGKPLRINGGADCLLATDFGDAPDSYRTLKNSGGPKHILSTVDNPEVQLTIGDIVDPELDGIPGPGADGDDKNLPVNDEDGVAPGTVVDALAPELEVPIVNTSGAPATLAAWLDFDLSGTFDATERLVVPVAPVSARARVTRAGGGTPWESTRSAAATMVSLRWAATAAAAAPSRRTESTSSTYLRLRLYPGTVADPQPFAESGYGEFVNGGEVEDHRLVLSDVPPTPTLPVSGADSRGAMLAGLGLLTAGSFAFVFAFRRRIRFRS